MSAEVMVPKWARDGLQAYIDAGGELDDALIEAITAAMASIYADALVEALLEASA